MSEQIHVVRRKRDLAVIIFLIPLGSCSVKTSEIEAIRIDGYWNSTIGVKLKGRKQIPLHLRLKYQNTLQEDEIMKELRTWSEIHQIPIQYKRISY